MSMSPRKIRLLYIDDERHNLYAFKAAFRLDFDIELAESAEEARALLLEKEIPIIIADQRMPRETGIEFFESIKERYPQSMRILLTGYTDIQAVISAVNLGNIYRYLQKPWNEEEIRAAVQSAFEIYDSRVQLIEKQQELEKAYVELDKFVYSASHDLRSPLMSILGIIKLARLENNPEANDQYFGMIEESVHRLDEFIKNIISYYKNNRIENEVSAIDMQQMVSKVIEANRYQELARNIQFEIDIQQPVGFRSDLLKLNIIFNNLISNAIKYQSPDRDEKKIWVNVVVNRDGARIEIGDNGIGVAITEQENIFKMFFRATSHNFGSGIGLYIVKDAVTRLNGKIYVDSEVGRGTIFRMDLPNLL
jgi:signal transduction histidine kinase